MPRRRSAALAGLVLGLTLLPLTGTAPATADGGTVTISGTAYEFNNVRTMLAGATVHVSEDPSLTTTVAADGTCWCWALETDEAATPSGAPAEADPPVHPAGREPDPGDLLEVDLDPSGIRDPACSPGPAR